MSGLPRYVAAGGAAILAVAALSPAATAASDPGLSSGCLGLDGSTFEQIADFSVDEYAFNAGERLTATFTDPRDGATSAAMTVGAWTRTTTQLPGSVTYTFPSTGVVDAMVFTAAPEGVVAVTFSCAPPVGAPPSVPPWVQEVGRPTVDATCAAGWAPSWSQWPGGGVGGFVCVRTVPSVG